MEKQIIYEKLTAVMQLLVGLPSQTGILICVNAIDQIIKSMESNSTEQGIDSSELRETIAEGVADTLKERPGWG